MLREERALGGSSRNLWVKLNLPEHPGERLGSGGGRRRSACLAEPALLRSSPGALAASPLSPCATNNRRIPPPPPYPTSCPADVQCYVSPILHQIRSSTSRIEAEQWVNANGGAGWIALEVRAWLAGEEGRPRPARASAAFRRLLLPSGAGQPSSGRQQAPVLC